jgi:SAM-dependent methyltransferase
MKPLALEYLELLRSELGTKFESKGLHVPMFSTVSGDCVKVSSSLSVDYWSSNLLSPVLFDSAARKLMSQFSDTVLLELGPHSTLAGPLREIVSGSGISYNYVSTLLRFSSSRDNFLSALGQLYQLGVHVDFTSLVPSQKTLHNLPTYPWDRTSYWSESRVSKDWRSRRHPHHPLLGQKTAESSTLEPSWRVLLSLENEPWLRDHKVLDDVVFPLAGYIAMAGEANRQLSGIEDGYEFRHIVAHTALVLMDSQPIELITNLRSYRLTDVSTSSWYEFSISSCAGSSWIEHCHGQVRAATGPGTSTDARSISTHEVSPSKWYTRAKHVGLDYGPEFRNLANIRSSTEKLCALGRITISKSQLNTPFLAHPCTLDSSFQLMLVPLMKEGHKSCELFVPTMIEELYISPIMKSMEAKAWISDNRKQNGIDGTVDGRVVIRLRNMRLSLHLKGHPESGLDRHAAAFLHWSPDFDFLDFRSLFRTSKANEYPLVEELGLLIVLDTAEQVQGITPHAPHLDKLGSWLRSQARSAHMGTYPIVPGCHSFAKLTKSERLEAIESRYQILKQLPGEVVPVDGLLRLWKNMPGIFKGDVNPLDLLLQDNVLAKFYDSLTNNFGSFLKALSNKRPTLRILEVGAGTGGATAKIFKELLSTDSTQNPPYAVYTFTDISAGFFEQAKDRFSAVPKIEYQIFDISKDPLDQGFTSHSYDLIIAANCVHATPKLQDTLRNLESLLRPDGYLLLSEFCSDSAFPRYIFGVFSGWWIGEMDDRKDSPIISLERWDKELKSAGFSGAASFAFEREEPYNYCAAIIAQPSNTRGNFNKSVTVLCDKPSTSISHNLIKHLRSVNFEVSIAALGQDISQKQSVISTLDLEAAFFDITEERFGALKNLLRHIKPEKFLWLLPPSQIHCRDPSAAKSLDMLRIVRAELAIPVTTLEICDDETDLSTIVTKVFEKIQPYNYEDNLLPDMDFVFDRGVIKSSRFHPFSLETALKKKRKQNSNSKGFELRIEQLGLLDTLGWTEKSNKDLRPKENEVNVDVRAVGINFRVSSSSESLLLKES